MFCISNLIWNEEEGEIGEICCEENSGTRVPHREGSKWPLSPRQRRPLVGLLAPSAPHSCLAKSLSGTGLSCLDSQHSPLSGKPTHARLLGTQCEKEVAVPALERTDKEDGEMHLSRSGRWAGGICKDSRQRGTWKRGALALEQESISGSRRRVPQRFSTVGI